MLAEPAGHGSTKRGTFHHAEDRVEHALRRRQGVRLISPRLRFVAELIEPSSPGVTEQRLGDWLAAGEEGEGGSVGMPANGPGELSDGASCVKGVGRVLGDGTSTTTEVTAVG
jgi:hypothetical protein